MTVALVVAIFGVVMPLIAYVSGSFQLAFHAEWPRIPMFIVKTSPWTPLLLAMLGVLAIVAKERFCKSRCGTEDQHRHDRRHDRAR